MGTPPRAAITSNASAVTVLCRPSEERMVVTANLSLDDRSRMLTVGERQDFRSAVEKISGDDLFLFYLSDTHVELSGRRISTLTEAGIRAMFANLPIPFEISVITVY